MSNTIGSVFSRVVGSSNGQSIILRSGHLKEVIYRGKIAENIANFAQCCFVRVESAHSSAVVPAREKSKFQNFVDGFMRRLKYNSPQFFVQFNHRYLSTAVKGEEVKLEEKAMPSSAQQTTAQTPTLTPSKKCEISYDELVTSFLRLDEKFLFDVREPSELSETGTLPHAINIPLTQLKASLQLDESEFITRFNIRKPSTSDSNLIVFYGLSSVKGMSALEIAHKLGFKKARYFPGGFEEWKTKEAAYLI